MAEQFVQDHVKLVVAKICLAMGWYACQSGPLSVLSDILSDYLSKLGTAARELANNCGRTEPNLHDLARAFADLHINLSDLAEYVTKVDFVAPPASVPKYPLPNQDQLHFLKPGSQEVLTRPVHVHDYFPPMHPLSEHVAEPHVKKKLQNLVPKSVVKRLPEASQAIVKRPRPLEVKKGSPREMTSVMMTSSGFLSPALEGRLPESRLPSPFAEELDKKRTKGVRKKGKMARELFKSPINGNDVKSGTTESVLTNYFVLTNTNTNSRRESDWNELMKIHNTAPLKADLEVSRIQNQFPNSTLVLLPPKSKTDTKREECSEVKLFAKPSKKKVNILRNCFRKDSFSKLKDELNELQAAIQRLPSDTTIQLADSISASESSRIDKATKTPEVTIQVLPPDGIKKSRRKDKSKVRRLLRRVQLDQEISDHLVMKNQTVEAPQPFSFFSQIPNVPIVQKRLTEQQKPKEVSQDPNSSLERTCTLPFQKLSNTRNLKAIIKEEEPSILPDTNQEATSDTKVNPTSPSESMKKSMIKFIFTKHGVGQSNSPPFTYRDADGNTVWFCPACQEEDDGSPMIGCDDCDAWYHWICAGIEVPPDDAENWFCERCIFKQEVSQTD